MHASMMKHIIRGNVHTTKMRKPTCDSEPNGHDSKNTEIGRSKLQDDRDFALSFLSPCESPGKLEEMIAAQDDCCRSDSHGII